MRRRFSGCLNRSILFSVSDSAEPLWKEKAQTSCSLVLRGAGLTASLPGPWAPVYSVDQAEATVSFLADANMYLL